MQYFIDHYKILNLSPPVSEEEIKRAFWKLAKRYHPDKKGNPYLFHQLYVSYQFLLNPDQRKAYDKIYRIYKAYKTQKIKRKLLLKNAIIIEPKRIRYSATLEKFLIGNINLKTIEKKERLRFLNLRYDYEVTLSAKEITHNLIFYIPIIAIRLCQYCFGAKLDCSFCKGIGRHRTEAQVRIYVPKHTLYNNQILLIRLKKKPNSYIFPTKKQLKLLIKIKKRLAIDKQ